MKQNGGTSDQINQKENKRKTGESEKKININKRRSRN